MVSDCSCISCISCIAILIVVLVRCIVLNKKLTKCKKASCLGMLCLIKMANSGSESSFHDEATDCQLEDDGHDDRVLAQPGIGASQGKPLVDDLDAQDKETVEANDPDGLLPQTLEARFERQIQVQEWRVPVSITYCSS